MTENEIAKNVVDAAYVVHCELGPGLLEHVYEIELQHELKKRGLNADRQVPIDIVYDNIRFDEGFRIDLLVGSKVIVEIKSVEDVHPKHKKTVLTYLRLADKRLALLINFNEQYIKDGITRLVIGLRDEANPTQNYLPIFLSSFASIAPWRLCAHPKLRVHNFCAASHREATVAEESE
jgi:GxxExxY protein